MQKLSFIILLVVVGLNFGQSPHGNNFKIDCQECHSTENWKIDYNKIKFNHSITDFELVGQHSTLDCRTCHTSIVFSNAKSECASCHSDIHQNSLGTNCEQCHNSNSWLVKDIDEIHMMSRFPLEGAHRLANCNDCHKSIDNLYFENLAIECVSCHRVDFQSTKQPDHVAAGFSTDCQDCHRITDIAWNKALVTHDFFPLVGGHKINNCFDCHSPNTFEGLSQDCIICHQADFNSTTNPNHVAGSFSTDCNECHTTSPDWRPASFKNHDNFFVLVGAHKEIQNDCAKCHTNGYTNTPDQCFDCHQSNYNGTNDPSHQAAGFGTDCESCHSSTAWKPATFDHDNEYFPIYSGKHNNEWNECSDCHTNSADYQIFECITCHEHNKTEMDNEHGGINGYTYESSACLACHPTGSKEGTFNHAVTSFPLVGAHTSVQCNDCHSSGSYQKISMECNACHLTDFQNSVNPNHQQLGLDQACEQCHTTNPDWKPASFAIHNDFYVLEGAHASISNDCNSCHTGGNYSNTGNLCMDCHQTDYNNTSNPNHQATGFGTTCEDCHSQNAWTPANFDHDNQYFPIYSGKHNNEWNDCADCHTNSANYQVFECITCHEHNKNDTDNDHSEVQGYLYVSTECFACHPNGDTDGAFNHAVSQFPLTGAHTNQECSDCHHSGYVNTPSQCEDCHIDNFNNSLDPNHNQSGISLNCEECHNTTDWKPSSFNHATTGFELIGGHNLAQCSDCHSVSTSNAKSECFVCHETKFNDAPEHLSQNYPHTCEDCHNTTDWKQTTFDHNNTNFVLTGAHVNSDCSNCHTSGYAGTSTECFVCHETKFNEAPEHLSQNYPHTCEDCHNTTDWKQTTFDHNNTNFVLTGAHVNSDCSNCHTSGYAGTSTECFVCHETKFNDAPEHLSQNYPHTCEDCHNTTDWKQTTFDHTNTQFALTGAHTNVNCGDCHTAGYSGTSTLCNDCHAGDFNSSSNPNHNSLGLSTACDNCHSTNSNWEPASFSVHNDYYVIKGAHSNIANDCATCHNGNYNTTPNQCYDCHQSDYNSTNNPPHQASGFGTTCEDCHSQNAWKPATFDHDGQYFPIYSGKHNNEWNNCSDCHTNQSDYSQFSCLECHEHNQTKMDDKHKDENGYVYQSSYCYDCHPNGKSDAALQRIPGLRRIFK